MRTLSAFCLLISAAAFAAEPLKFPQTPPTAPAEAEKTLEVLHGFRMELLAAEPLVTDPVALAYDADGRAFVAEMNDYPYTDKAHHKASQENPTDAPIGRIRMLVDDDGDGKFDRSTVFAEGLSWPTGIACWNGGIVVTATPDVWFLKDTDGDGKADVREKMLTGFKKLNVQAVLNNPVWGLDHRLYLAGGTNGGEVLNLLQPGSKPVLLRRADVQFDPRTKSIAAVSGGARFGNNFDDWGNRFLCNIRNPAQHIAIESRYLARNPYLPATSPLVDVAESGDQLPVHRASPPEAWREFRARRWSADSTVAAHMPRSELVGSGVVTSSAGVTVYRGDAYPAEFLGNIFVADVAGNLFYRLGLQPDGITFKAQRPDPDHEMCAGKDLWFRPVNFTNAPDGCLHVCDMYREVIEHPWSLPDDIHAALDLERGRDMGRLYRLTPPGFKVRPTPKLSQATTSELVDLLAHPNAWHRETAHRLLFERQDRSAIGPTRALFMASASALARLHALWTLAGLDALEEADLQRALSDADEHVRVQAILLAEDRLNTSEPLRTKVLALATDPAPRVQYQAALSLGEATDPRRISALVEVARRGMADSWMRTAVLSASGAQTADVATQILTEKDSSEAALFLRDAGVTVGAGGKLDAAKALVAAAAQATDRPQLQSGTLLGLARGLARQKKSLRDVMPAEAGEVVARLAAEARTKALAPNEPLESRVQAVSLLTLSTFDEAAPVARRLLEATQPDAIRVACVQHLQERTDSAVAPLVLSAWRTMTPAPREAAATALLTRAEWQSALLDAVGAGQIRPAELSPTIRAALGRSIAPGVKQRAAELFSANGSRAEALARYQAVLSLSGDRKRGEAVYTANCAACHRKGEAGRDIGPNLATVASWSAEQLLTNILDPNREVSPNFMLYTVDLKDGRSLAGLIAAETDSSLSLKGLDGVEMTVARSEVATVKATGTSPMPEGLERVIPPPAMADLLTFLRDVP